MGFGTKYLSTITYLFIFHQSFLIIKKTLLYSAFYGLALALLTLPLRAQTTTFNATGGNQSYRVPANGTLTITVKGGDGGDSRYNSNSFEGGSATTVSATFAVQKGDELTIVAGKSGNTSARSPGGGIVSGSGGSGGGGYGYGNSGGGGFGNARGGGFGSTLGGLIGGGGLFDGGAGGWGSGGGGGGSSYSGGGGGGYKGGDAGKRYGSGGDGGSSFVQTDGVFAGTSTSVTNGTNGGATGRGGSVVLDLVADQFFECPKLTASTPSTNALCSGDNSSRIGLTTTRNDLGVKLVYFTAATTTPYSRGTALAGPVTPSGGASPYAVSFGSLSFPPNNTAAPVTYYVYALLDTDDADLTREDCRPSVAYTVTVNPLPRASIASNGGATCAGNDATFSLSGTSGATLTYTITGRSGNQTLALDGTSQTLTASGATNDVTLTLVSVAKDGCQQNLSATSTVTVKALPTASIAGNGGATCAGGDATFSLSGTSGATLTYTITGQSGNQTLALDGTSQTLTASGATNDVTLTLVSVVKDGCQKTLTATSTVTVNSPPTVTPGPDQSVVFGYGSNCTDITASANGMGPFTYQWDMGAGSGDKVNVCPSETTTYTVTVTDGNGCKATGMVKVNVKDVRCGPNGQNVTICYYGVTQCVSPSLAKRYQKLGATIGGYGSGSARIGTEEAADRPLTLSLEAYPNPVQDAVTVKILAPKSGPASFEVLDLTGRARQSRQQELVEGLNQVEFRLGTLPSGVYLIRAVDVTNRQGVVRVSKQ